MAGGEQEQRQPHQLLEAEGLVARLLDEPTEQIVTGVLVLRGDESSEERLPCSTRRLAIFDREGEVDLRSGEVPELGAILVWDAEHLADH